MFVYLLPFLLLMSSQALGMKRPATEILNQSAKIQRGTNYSKELQDALHQKDTAQALALIEKLTPATVNDTRDEHSALIDAILYNNKQVIQMLLAKGALPYAGQDSPMASEFLIAVITHNTEKVKELLELDVDVNVRTDFDFNPLLCASALGYEDIVKILLQHPLINIHACDCTQTDALMYAAIHNHVGVMDLLVKAGINHNLRNRLGYTALMAAMQCKQILAVHYLLDLLLTKVDANIAHTNGLTLLMYAVEIGNRDIISTLIDKGADIHAVNQKGHTALTLALRGEQNEIATLLIDAGAKTDLEFEDGVTLLLLAVAYSDARVIEKLLRNGAAVHINTQKEGLTPLIWAATFGYVEKMRLLIAHNADIEAHTQKGNTALSLAIEKKQPEAAKLLIDAGAKTNIRLENGDTLLHLAVIYSTSQVVEKLLGTRATVHINTPNKSGWTPLMWAASRCYVEIMSLLLAHNANIEAASQNGVTAFSVALGHKHNEAIKLLINNNAKTVGTFGDGETTLSRASTYCSAEVVEMLLKTDARMYINKENSINAHTALTKALIRSDIAIAKLLMAHGAELYNPQAIISCLIKDKSAHFLRTLAFILHTTPVSNHADLLKDALDTAHKNQNWEPVPWLLSKLAPVDQDEKPYKPLLSPNKDEAINTESVDQIVQKQTYENKKEEDVAVTTNMLFKFYRQPSLNDYLTSSVQFCNNFLNKLDTTNTFARYEYNQTPVMWASMFGHLATTQKIIGHLFSPQVSGYLTTFTFEKLDPVAAIGLKMALTTPKVINASKFINAQDVCGRTALMYAIMYSNFDIARALLPYALSSICLKDKYGKTALTYAIQKRNTALIEAILKYYTILNNHLKSKENFFRPTVEDIRIAAEEDLPLYAAKLLGYLKEQRIL